MLNKMINRRMEILIYSITIVFITITSSYAAVIPSGIQLSEKQEIIRNNGAEPASLDVDKAEDNVSMNINNE